MAASCIATRLSVFVVALAFAAPAHAGTTLVASDGTERPQPFQRWVDSARVPTPDVRVSLHLAPCPSRPSTSCAHPDGWIFFYGEHLRGTWKWDFLHEIGHHFDYVEMTDADRLQFRRMMRDRRPWRAAPNSPHERFAEAWSQCARSARWLFGFEPSHGEKPLYTYGYSPTLTQHRRVCALIRRAART